MPRAVQGCNGGVSEVLLRRGCAAARHLPVHGQAVQYATGESPADKRGAHDADSRRPDRDCLLRCDHAILRVCTAA